MKTENQVIQKEMKAITMKIESHNLIDFEQILLQSTTFIQEGQISKGNMQKLMIRTYGSGKVVDDYEIRFILNLIDKDNNQALDIDELQSYLKLYSKNKRISAPLYFKYFGFQLDRDHPKVHTPTLLPYEKALMQKQSPDCSRQFAQFVKEHFQQAKKVELLQDLYDIMGQVISDSSIDAVMSYFYACIDQFRESIAQSSKFIMRQNVNLRNEIINELLKQRPNFPIYCIMDDLQFTEEQGTSIPSLTLKSHLKKLYPYVEENRLKFFVAMVDVNGDQKIEILELFRFFNEVYGQEMSYASVLNRLGMIIYTTRETIESFFKIHQINVLKIQQSLSFVQFVQAIAQIFRISKYEAFIIFNELKKSDTNLIDFRAFLDSLQGELKRIELKDQDVINHNKAVEDRIEAYKNKVADGIKNKLQKMVEAQEGHLQKEVNNDESEAKNGNLTNRDIMKIFLDNYEHLNTLPLIKRACLNLQYMIKHSSVLRSQLLTKRACQANVMYQQLSRVNLYDQEEQKVEKEIFLSGQEKIILIVLALENVTKVFECNIYRFTKMVKRLNADTSTLDFQMMDKILQQRHKQIGELLYEDFLTIQNVVEKIRTAHKALNEGQQMVLQFKEWTPIFEILNVLSSYLKNKFVPKEIVLISRELKITKENHQVNFSNLKMFLAQCEIQTKLQETLNLIFDTLDHALIGLDALKTYLNKNPYIKLNEGLIKTTEYHPIEWVQQAKISVSSPEVMSPLHQNSVMLDCIAQTKADQSAQKTEFVAFDDQESFMVIKIQSQYVIIDKQLPYSLKNQNQPQPLFTHVFNEPLTSFIEKAIATFLGSYDALKIKRSLSSIFQMLNCSQIETYILQPGQGFSHHFQNLYENYFQKSINRLIYFRMPSSKKKNPLLNGLESGRVYAIIAMLQLKIDTKTTHNLGVIYNPYIQEDPRKNGEIWSKGFLINAKKNKKYIDLINANYDPSVYKFITDKDNNVYTYDLRNVFENQDKEYELLIMYNLQSRADIVKKDLALNFDNSTEANLMTITCQNSSSQDSKTTKAFGLIQIQIDDTMNNSFILSLNLGQSDIQSFQFNYESTGPIFSKSFYLALNQKTILKLSVNSKENYEPFESLVSLCFLKEFPLDIQSSELLKDHQPFKQENQASLPLDVQENNEKKGPAVSEKKKTEEKSQSKNEKPEQIPNQGKVLENVPEEEVIEEEEYYDDEEFEEEEKKGEPQVKMQRAEKGQDKEEAREQIGSGDQKEKSIDQKHGISQPSKIQGAEIKQSIKQIDEQKEEQSIKDLSLITKDPTNIPSQLPLTKPLASSSTIGQSPLPQIAPQTKTAQD